MLKLIKHEILKDKITYIMIFAAMIAVEAYFLISFGMRSRVNMITSSALFILGGVGGIFFLLILGLISYSRELSSKYSYMTFMTPNSTRKIVGAKYLTIFGITAITSIMYVGFIILDASMVLSKYSQIDLFLGLVEAGAGALGMDFTKWLGEMAATLVQIWIGMILTISCGYLAITFSRTIMAGKKSNGFLTTVLFIIIVIMVNVIDSYIPQIKNTYRNFSDLFVAQIPNYIFKVAVIVSTYFFVSHMLKKKISL